MLTAALPSDVATNPNPWGNLRRGPLTTYRARHNAAPSK